jgi:catechol 2,3-dioxygenase-like lactoylglutathione lyase family enzyme
VRVQHVRIARATNRLGDVVAFYRDILGLDVLATFEDHAGFDGVMLGRRDHAMHFEFTHERGAGIAAVPSPEDLIVFYLEDADWVATDAARRSAGIPAVRSHNPYWDEHGVTIEDPDGYRIVLHRGPWRLGRVPS